MQVKGKLGKIERLKNLELKKIELYGIMAVLIMEKEHFPKIENVTNFLDDINIQYSNVIKDNRKLLFSKVIEDIIQADEETLDLIAENTMDSIKELSIEKEVERKKEPKNKEKDYIEKLLNKYSRNK
jgi:hypothetical protein